MVKKCKPGEAGAGGSKDPDDGQCSPIRMGCTFTTGARLVVDSEWEDKVWNEA